MPLRHANARPSPRPRIASASRLRAPAAQRRPRAARRRLCAERRAGPHRPDAGLRPRHALDGGAIAGGENEAVADAAQCRVHPHATRGVAGQPGVGEEARSHHPRRPQRGRDLQEAAVGERQPAVDPHSRRHAANQFDAGLHQCTRATDRAWDGAVASGSAVSHTSTICARSR